MDLNFLLGPLIQPRLDHGPTCLKSSRSVDNKHLSQVFGVKVLVYLGDFLYEVSNLLAHVSHALQIKDVFQR